MQQRGNMVAFMVLSLFILIGWMFVQNRIWPPKLKEAEKQEAVAKIDEKKAPPVDWSKWSLHGRAANLIAHRIPTGDALTDAGQLFADLEQITPSWSPLARTATLVADRAFPADPLTGLAQTYADLGRVAPPEFEPKRDDPKPEPTAKVEPKVEPKKKDPPPQVAKTETIGGEGYFLEAKLTTKGAGVQALWLTQFKAANYLGKPVPGERLELIREDHITPSFLMLHYPVPNVKPNDPVSAGKHPKFLLGDVHWKLEGKETLPNGMQKVTFSTTALDEDPTYSGLLITKTYQLEPRAYHLTLEIKIQDQRPQAEKSTPRAGFRYQLTGSHGMPVEGEWFTNTNRDALIALVDSRGSVDRRRQDANSISLKGGGDAVPDTSTGDFKLQYAGVALQYFASVIVDEERETLEWARPTKESSEIVGRFDEADAKTMRLATKDGSKEFDLLPRVAKQIQALNLKQNSAVVVSYYADPDDNTKNVATWIRLGNTPRTYFDDISVRVTTRPVELEPGGKATRHVFKLYHGPVKTRLLAQFGGDMAVPGELVSKYTDEWNLYTLTDYRSDGPFGSFSQTIGLTSLLIAVTKLMHTLLHWFSYLGGYGIAIILLTVIVRGAMFPISRKQALFAMRMQQLGPELKKIQEKYKSDPKARTEATMEFYRKHKINPFASCLPLIMQMPIFLGLYFALQESIHFRLARFLWIENLAAPDMLVYWSQSIPWISDPDNIGGMFYLGPYFNLLPLIAVALMVVQQKMMAPPVMDEQQAMQMKVMRYMMIFIAVLFYKVAAGLAIYFIASSLWGVAERKLLPKKEAGEPILATTGPGKGNPGRNGPGGRGGQGGKSKPPVVDETGLIARIKKWWQNVLDEAKKK